jgi:hypothetical protein
VVLHKQEGSSTCRRKQRCIEFGTCRNHSPLKSAEEIRILFAKFVTHLNTNGLRGSLLRISLGVRISHFSLVVPSFSQSLSTRELTANRITGTEMETNIQLVQESKYPKLLICYASE